MGEWYVLHCKPHKENQVYAYLQAQRFEVFYPTMRIQPTNPRASKIRPYFPRYMFVNSDLEAVGVSALQWIPNTIGLVCFDNEAVPVSPNVIYELRCRIEEIEAAGGEIFDGLKPGDRVRIIHGPLAGYEAIFDFRLSDSERVQVLLELLGKQIKVKINASMIEKQHQRFSRTG